MPRETIESILKNLSKDNSDLVKVHIMKLLTRLSQIQEVLNNDLLIEILDGLISDDSWRVRFTVIDNAYKLIINSKISYVEKILQIYISSLDDKEPEVRNNICFILEKIFDTLSKTNHSYDTLLSNLIKFEKDTSTPVKASFAGNILKISKHIGKSKTNDFIIPIVLNILKDENHEIRIALLNKLEDLDPVIPIETIFQPIQISLIEIISNKTWRIRVRACEIIEVLSRILKRDTFIDKILPLCLNWTHDSICAIRKKGNAMIAKFYSRLKNDRFNSLLIDKANELLKSSSYLIRISLLNMIQELANIIDASSLIENDLIDMVIKLSKDKISNVRLNCPDTLMTIQFFCKDKDIKKMIFKILEDLQNDIDIDVKRNAVKALSRNK